MKFRTGFRVFVAVILLLLVWGSWYFFSGRYNVAADEPHWSMTRWMLNIVKEQSIEARLGEIDVPDLAGEEMIREGAVHYAPMCAGCHLKPGQKNTELRQGLNPRPPRLTRRASDPAAAFWVVKHGIRMTGMPAWGETHSDRDIWNIVAFLQQLPDMTPDEYAELTAAADDGHSHDHGTGSEMEESSGEPEEETEEHDHEGHEH